MRSTKAVECRWISYMLREILALIFCVNSTLTGALYKFILTNWAERGDVEETLIRHNMDDWR